MHPLSRRQSLPRRLTIGAISVATVDKRPGPIMSLPEKAFPVSWDQFHRDARALAWRIAGVGNGWKGIVCITRGGLVPAAIISRELGIRVVETVCVASYHDYATQGDIRC